MRSWKRYKKGKFGSGHLTMAPFRRSEEDALLHHDLCLMFCPVCLQVQKGKYLLAFIAEW